MGTLQHVQWFCIIIGDNNTGGDGKEPTTGALSETGCSGFLCPLLNPIVVLVLLVWCGVLSFLCLVLCCCIQQRKRNEKKRKYYVDYLRRQNPYMESLHSKDYTWHDYSTVNGENGSSGPGSHPEEAKSDTGIMNSMVTNENEGYGINPSHPARGTGGTITAADANL
ncbi:unnamed protein product [Owenia fusiformis]|uniref:Uncharacterized protein n=1 Tax=Owenia fusiformis TaxID=6347 RepID=A0A8J1TVK2_OWEFU|nr:unnamed protein product [Owenia fusiformis]